MTSEESQPLLSHAGSSVNASGGVHQPPAYSTNRFDSEALERSEDEDGITSFGLDTTTDQDLDQEPSVWDRSIRFVQDNFSLAVIHKTLGIILVICAGFSFTSSNVMQKFSVKELTFWQLLGNRAILQVIGVGTTCVVQHLRSSGPDRNDWTYMFLGPRGVRRRVILQGMLGGVLLACMFVAVKFVPLGNASAIMFCTPIFTFFMAPFMLSGERLGLYRVMVTALMATGVLFITRPDTIFGAPMPMRNSSHFPHTMPDDALPDNLEIRPQMAPPPSSSMSSTLLMVTGGPALTLDSHYTHRAWTKGEMIVGYICCFSVPMLSAFISLVTRQCNVAKTPVNILMFWFGVGAITVVTVATVSLNVFDTLFTMSLHEVIVTTSITALGIFGNMCYTVAVKFVSPSVANVFRSFEVILNFALQVKLEGHPAYDINFVGITLLLMAVLMMSYENRAHAKWSRTIKCL